MYRSEACSLKKADAARLKVFKMCFWRKIKGVKWTDKLTNAEILNLLNETPKQLTEIRRKYESLLRTAFKRRMKNVQEEERER